MSVIAKFKPQKMDLVRAGYVAVRSNTVLFYAYVFFFIFLPWAILVYEVLADKPIQALDILMPLVIPFCAVAFFFFLPVLLGGNAPGLKGEHVYTFSEEGIRTEGPGFDNRIQWSLITRYVKVNGIILIYSGKTPVISIPKRGLSDSDRNELEVLLNRQMQR